MRKNRDPLPDPTDSTKKKKNRKSSSIPDSTSTPSSSIPDSTNAPDAIPDSTSTPSSSIPDSTNAPDAIPDSTSAPDAIPDSASAPDAILDPVVAPALRFSGRKIGDLSTMKTFQEWSNDLVHQKKFWRRIGSTMRPTDILKIPMRIITRALLAKQRKNKMHGDIKAENIIFLNDDFTIPYIVNWKGTASERGDLPDLCSLFEEIFKKSKKSLKWGEKMKWDNETDEFLEDLKTGLNRRKFPYLWNHYWFHTAIDRFRFFTENETLVFNHLKTKEECEPILGIPEKISEGKLEEGSFLKRCVDRTTNDIDFNFMSSLKFLRIYYKHGFDEEGYNEEVLEEEIFMTFPTLMKLMYETLQHSGVAHNYWNT